MPNDLGQLIDKEVDRAFSDYQTIRNRAVSIVGLSTGLVALISGLLAIAAGSHGDVLTGAVLGLLIVALLAYVASTISALIVQFSSSVVRTDVSDLEDRVDEDWTAEGWEESIARLNIQQLISYRTANDRKGSWLNRAIAGEIVALVFTAAAGLSVMNQLSSQGSNGVSAAQNTTTTMQGEGGSDKSNGSSGRIRKSPIGTGSTSGFRSSTYTVYGAYADTVPSRQPSFTPSPWGPSKRPALVFDGCQPVDACVFDGGAVLIHNDLPTPITVDEVIMYFGPCSYNYRPEDLLSGFASLIVTANPIDKNGAGNDCQQDLGKMDTSDTSSDSGLIPRIAVIVDGQSSIFVDKSRVLNTGGRDPGVNEGRPWTLLEPGTHMFNPRESERIQVVVSSQSAGEFTLKALGITVSIALAIGLTLLLALAVSAIWRRMLEKTLDHVLGRVFRDRRLDDLIGALTTKLNRENDRSSGA